MRDPLPPLVAERLRALRERPIEPAEKGSGPPGVVAAAARPALRAAGFTCLLLPPRESALAGNVEAMAARRDWAGVALAPEGYRNNFPGISYICP